MTEIPNQIFDVPMVQGAARCFTCLAWGASRRSPTTSCSRTNRILDLPRGEVEPGHNQAGTCTIVSRVPDEPGVVKSESALTHLGRSTTRLPTYLTSGTLTQHSLNSPIPTSWLSPPSIP